MSAATLWLPRLYAIVDSSCFSDATEALNFAATLLDAGVTLLQYRDKNSSSRAVLSFARELKRINRNRAKLIMNDRADLALAANFGGVHLGQDDVSVASARKLLGKNKIIGFSTHNLHQLKKAETTSADYIAFGPIFETRSKLNPDPIVGLDGLRAASKLTSKPLVAIGGITRSNCRSATAVGADSVAVIADLLDSPARRVEEFFRELEYKS